jgi:ligand-binding SRPBCC domain-containing protein
MYSLERIQRIPAPLDAVFAFFSDPANLARITPPSLSFRIHGEAPSSLSEGSRIEYRIRWGLFRLRWVTRITLWRPNAEFQDVQEKGPYAVWIHTHGFAPGDGGVIMRDRVEYALPFGVVGRLVHALAVRRQLERIFDFRARTIGAIFAARAAAG